jgi:RNase P subunit RPR2
MPRRKENPGRCKNCGIWYPDNYLMTSKSGSKNKMVWWCRACADNDKKYAERPEQLGFSMISEC